MAQNLPIRFQELLNLSNLGVNPNAISFAFTTMESDKYICVRDTSEPPSLVIVDLESSLDPPLRFPSAADAAVMNPKEKIIALKAQQQIQIYHIQQKQRLKMFQMPEPVVFWKWISPTVLAMVTLNAVWHWSLEDKDPVKFFDRHADLAQSQIINYRTDKNLKWAALIGLTSKDNKFVGNIQLYSSEKKISQSLEGHMAAFANYQLEGGATSTLFCFASRTAAQSKIFIFEVSRSDPNAPGFTKKIVDIYFPPEAAADFPVAMQVSEKYNIVYMITKFGYVYLFDLTSGTTIYWNRISADVIFVTALHTQTDGIVGVNKKGQVLLVSVDENNLVPYICNTLNNLDLAIAIASKNNLQGADDLFFNQFNRLFQAGNYMEAAKVAAESPKGILRTLQTIQRFQQLPETPGQVSPLLAYFKVLLDKGLKLNRVESLELARPAVQQGKIQTIEKCYGEKKMEPSEELGDLVKPFNLKLASTIYHQAEAHGKVVACLAESGQFDKLVPYCKQTHFTPDWYLLLQNVIQVAPQTAVTFALALVSGEGGPLVDINRVVDLFMARNLLPETTSFLLDVLKNNRPEEGALQTRLLELNLVQAPLVADYILGNQMFTHYNRPRIAQLCERAGLYQRALEHYSEMSDFKRVLLNTHAIDPEFLVNFFRRISVEDTLECLKDLLKVNLKQNLATVAKIAVKYSEHLTPAAVISLFQSFECAEGLYLYLSQIVNFSEDPEVHFKYIEAASKVNQIEEVVRICKESNFYDPKKTKDFLKEARLADQLPLIIVCDRFEFVEELTQYLYKNNMSKYLEAYVQKINPANTPAVVGALLDVDCNEQYIKNLVISVRTLCPVAELVEQVEKRNRLKILTSFLEALVQEGSTDPATHNAVAKIYIDVGNNPEQFLQTNQYYESLVVGKYCENRDPNLAFIAYRRGLCDQELVEVTNKNGLFKNQARYLVERQDLELWTSVLQPTNPHRRSVIDQVVQTALPEVNNPEEISATVKAFMNANLPKELIELLEKIVLEGGTKFTGNRDLGNLLILTAIKADTSKVMDYIRQLDNYDAVDIANIAVGSELFEEAFEIFKKFKHNVQAIEVLIDHIHSIERATEFAERVNDPEVWSKLAHAQLVSPDGLVKEAIESYIKANDPEFYNDVINAAELANLYEDLVKYLQMARKKVREAKIESELIYAYAKINNLADLEEFINTPNCAKIQEVGDRCFNERLFEAARLLFSNIGNYSRLAGTLVQLGQFQPAVEAARKANNTRTWKEINLACVEAGEFRLAQICGLNIIIHGDELEELIKNYEVRGHFQELISLIEQGLGLERAHVGMFTELAILYSKYKAQKLMEHLKLYHTRLNIPKVIRTVEKNQQFVELTYLYIRYDEFDNAVLTMVNQPDAWDHTLFRDTIVKATNLDNYYKAVSFYLAEHPLLVNELLHVLVPRIDHSRVVSLVRKLGHLPLIKPYLVSVQEANVPAVNEAVNELYIDEQDYETLRHSIDSYGNFDQIVLAKKLEVHELLEFRRISAYLYKKNKQWQQSVELSKQDKLYKDAMQTAADSKNQSVAEELLTFFVEKVKSKECFAACLYTCYDLIRPDIALDLAWRHQMTDFCMPFLIQVVREYTTKVENLIEAGKPKEKTGEDKPDSFNVNAQQQQPPPQTGFYPVVAPQTEGFYGVPGVPGVVGILPGVGPIAAPMSVPIGVNLGGVPQNIIAAPHSLGLGAPGLGPQGFGGGFGGFN